MGADPVRQRLRPGRFRIGEVGGAENGDEDLRLADLAGQRVDDGDLLAGIVDEDLVAGDMVLPHRRRQPPLEAAKQIAEPAVAVAAGMDRAIFFPQDQQGDARLLQLDDQLGPVRLRAPPHALLDPGRVEQPASQGHRRSARPAAASSAPPLPRASDCPERCCAPRPASGQCPGRWRRLRASRSICRSCLMVSLLFAGITSLSFDRGT